MKTLQEARIEAREQTKRDGNERLFYVSRSGGVSDILTGDRTSVANSEAMIEALGSVHTHPNEMTFSDSDVENLLFSELEWIEVITPSYVYRLEKRERVPEWYNYLFGLSLPNVDPERIDSDNRYRRAVILQIAEENGLTFTERPLDKV